MNSSKKKEANEKARAAVPSATQKINRHIDITINRRDKSRGKKREATAAKGGNGGRSHKWAFLMYQNHRSKSRGKTLAGQITVTLLRLECPLPLDFREYLSTRVEKLLSRFVDQRRVHR